MLNRNITRTILGSTETTAKTAMQAAETLAFSLTTSSVFYVGSKGRFQSRYFDIKTGNTEASVLTVEYWDGDAWVAVDDLQDQTAYSGKTMYKSGFVSWVNPDDWVKKSQFGVDTDIELYWIRMSVSANFSSGVVLRSVSNLFSDDESLRVMYPEIANDAAYLPEGKTNFLDQHWAAKNLVVLRLKQRHLIDDEHQILDASLLEPAATHACAFIILNPIATSDAHRELADRALRAFKDEIGQTNFSVDLDKDGVISEAEELYTTDIRVTRR